LHSLFGTVFAIPMPHTSGMAWNRRAPSAQRWSEVGAEQVALAVGCLEVSHVPGV
jgi:DNA polymerase